MIPVLAIVGRPNVGKSTLFNQLTRSRDALVLDLPGVTRDRIYGEGKIGDKPFIVIDTGGLYDEGIEKEGRQRTTKTEVTKLMAEQSWQAVNEADVVLFMVNAREGMTANDYSIAKELRKMSKTNKNIEQNTEKNIYLVVNKMDGLNQETALADFFELGFDPIPISASHAQGIDELIEHSLAHFVSPLSSSSNPMDVEEGEEKEEGEVETEAKGKKEKDETGIKISIVGRPNVGKSTLVNRLLGEPRVVVFDEPGTTRDSIYVPFDRFDQHYTLIDTAGVRRRSRIDESLEKFSVVKTLQAIQDSHVVILVVDAVEGITDQDLGLLGFILETGRSLVVAVNKWDGLTIEHKNQVKQNLQYRLNFANFAKVHYISALHGSGVGNLFDSVQAAFRSATQDLPTSKLTRILSKAVELHAPPLVQGRRIKLRYAHAGGHNPPVIVIHGNQTEHVPDSYRRYLMNSFRKGLKLVGTPVKLEFKTSENPYASRRNKLTPRQEYKRKRLREYHKKSKKK